jgi:phenylalanyl-tRNA synthetase beta chain
LDFVLKFLGLLDWTSRQVAKGTLFSRQWESKLASEHKGKKQSMRISLNWLRELVGVALAAEELAHLLTMAGFEVEEIEDRRSWADGVVVGKVVVREQHPNADRLSVCQVDIGTGELLNIVCGAANVRSDIYVAVATLGTYLPKVDLKLKATKLRGVKSEGMICSLAELGLAKESSGIHIFEPAALQDSELGSDVRPLLGLEDVILDLSSTANRADALSMVGIAREVRALTQAPLTLPKIEIPASQPATEVLSLQIEAYQACPLYVGTVIEGVTIAPSPNWLQRHLEAAGIRPINNVVDITNFVLLEWGQPLHAFDLSRLQTLVGQQNLKVGVRFAMPGETLKTLDGQTRQLQTHTLVIVAHDQPVALGGVMGGEATEVHEGTQSLMLEAAWFEPVVIRRSARSQGLRTEASTRYERGVNQAELAIANQRALDLIATLTGGKVISQSIADARPKAEVASGLQRELTLRLERVRQVLGYVERGEDLGELEPEEIEATLTALGCELSPLSEAGTWVVKTPAYRYRDLEREIDLIEEVARLYGYDNFSDTLPAKTELGYLPIDQQLTRLLRETFRAAGLTELIHYSLVKPGPGQTPQDHQIQLANPLLAEYSALRTDLIDGLIDAFQYNLEQGNGSLNGFEVGRIFGSDEEGLDETDAVGGILGGDPHVGKWVRSGREQPLSWYEAKGVLESVFQRLGLSVESQPDRRDHRLHPGRTASLWIGGNSLGRFGQLHPQLCQERDLPQQVYVFQLDLLVLLNALVGEEEETVTLFRPFSAFPASDRDLAFYVNTEISVADLNRVMRKAAGQLLESVNLFDEYRGEHVPEGQRSLAFRLIYRASDRTLTDAEVDPVHQKVRDTLVTKFNVSLRS